MALAKSPEPLDLSGQMAYDHFLLTQLSDAVAKGLKRSVRDVFAEHPPMSASGGINARICRG